MGPRSAIEARIEGEILAFSSSRFVTAIRGAPLVALEPRLKFLV